MGILYEEVRYPNLWRYAKELNDDGTEKHIVCEGAQFHVLSYSTQGVRCSEPNCEINKERSNAALRGDSGFIAGVPLESTVMQRED